MRLLVPSLSLLLLAPAAVTAGTPKVDVCHVTGSATNPVSLLSVSSSAVATHLAHGDYAPYTVYADMDLDGFGDAGDSFGSNCLTPEGYVEDDTDCDDTNPDVNPAAGETDYNGVDDDCDAGTPDDDLDGDGYDLAEDRDDLDDAVNPGVVESEYSGVDHDCDASTPDDDLDGDGYELANCPGPAISPS